MEEWSLKIWDSSCSTCINIRKNRTLKKCPKCALWFVQKDIIKDHISKMHVTQRRKAGLVPWPVPRVTIMVPKSRQEEPVEEDDVDISNVILNDVKENLKCKECSGNMTSPNHFPALLFCANNNCQFSTCCRHAMNKHATECRIFHSTLPVQRLPFRMYCVCGYNDFDGNLMAKHLTVCERKSAYPSDEAAKAATVTHSMLDVLGLVRRPEEPVTTTNEIMEIDSDDDKISDNQTNKLEKAETNTDKQQKVEDTAKKFSEKRSRRSKHKPSIFNRKTSVEKSNVAVESISIDDEEEEEVAKVPKETDVVILDDENKVSDKNEEESVTEDSNEKETVTEKLNEEDSVTTKSNEEENEIEESNKESVTEKPNEEDNVYEKPNEEQNVRGKPNEEENLTGKPNEEEIVTETPNEENVKEKPNKQEDVAEKPNEEEEDVTENPNEEEEVTETPNEEGESAMEKPNKENVMEKSNEEETVADELTNDEENIVEKLPNDEENVEKAIDEDESMPEEINTKEEESIIENLTTEEESGTEKITDEEDNGKGDGSDEESVEKMDVDQDQPESRDSPVNENTSTEATEVPNDLNSPQSDSSNASTSDQKEESTTEPENSNENTDENEINKNEEHDTQKNDCEAMEVDCSATVKQVLCDDSKTNEVNDVEQMVQ